MRTTRIRCEGNGIQIPDVYFPGSESRFKIQEWEAEFFRKLYVSYGTVYAVINIIILILDIIMKEKIGFGTLFDAFLTGYYVDFRAYLNPFPKMPNLFCSALLLIAGLFVMAVGQYFYMSAAEGCGPIGIGTVLSVVFMGTAMQIVFHLFHFEPRNVRHKSLIAILGMLRQS